jgi:hypothetical protein
MVVPKAIEFSRASQREKPAFLQMNHKREQPQDRDDGKAEDRKDDRVPRL